jgi:SPP1 gp7 family putative phage head morphogenesis protein
MQTELSHLYGGCDCCTTESFTMASVEEQEINKLAALAAKEAERIWKLKSMPEKLNPILTQAYASIFMDGVKQGYGVDLSQIDYDTPDAEMLKNLTNNVYNFSSAKNYTQMRQLTQAIIGGDGKIRSFSEFKKAAFTINQEHTLNWLNAEYDTAISSAQMARKWVDIQSNKDTLGLLQFDAIIDSNTSPICKPLDLVIKPVDDPFWNTYYPPNHYRCRSTVKQLRSGKVTPNHEVVHPEKGIPDMFKTNLAKTGMIFPSGHPYWEGVPETVIKEGQSVLRKDIEKWGKENLRNRKFETASIGSVDFTGASIEEILHKSHFNKIAKNLTLYNFEEILKTAELVQISPDAKGNPYIKQWYYLKFNVLGKASYINVREMENGQKTVYAITDHLK